MKLRIVPNDTLFFRDGKPFSLGDETWADDIFPPYPATLYGSIRTAYIAHHGGLEKFKNGDMAAKIGTISSPPPADGLRLKCIHLAYSADALAAIDRAYYPAPLDLAISKENPNRLVPLQPRKDDGLVSSCPLPHLLLPKNRNEEVTMPPKAFIHETAFWAKYFLDFYDGIQLRTLDDFLLDEPKVGIGRSRKTHTSEEGQLYRVGMKRLQSGWSIYANVDGFTSADLPTTGLLKLGGENKTAVFSCFDDNIGAHRLDPNETQLKSHIAADQQFKLYLMTPALFRKNGWYPDNVKEGWSLETTPFKLIAAAVGKPVHIGGWDMGNNHPKEMLRAVPAGAVYYFCAESAPDEVSIDKIIADFHRNNIGQRAIEGFGHCLITRWSKNQHGH